MLGGGIAMTFALRAAFAAAFLILSASAAGAATDTVTITYAGGYLPANQMESAKIKFALALGPSFDVATFTRTSRVNVVLQTARGPASGDLNSTFIKVTADVSAPADGKAESLTVCLLTDSPTNGLFGVDTCAADFAKAFNKFYAQLPTATGGTAGSSRMPVAVGGAPSTFITPFITALNTALGAAADFKPATVDEARNGGFEITITNAGSTSVRWKYSVQFSGAGGTSAPTLVDCLANAIDGCVTEVLVPAETYRTLVLKANRIH